MAVVFIAALGVPGELAEPQAQLVGGGPILGRLWPRPASLAEAVKGRLGLPFELDHGERAEAGGFEGGEPFAAAVFVLAVHPPGGSALGEGVRI